MNSNCPSATVLNYQKGFFQSGGWFVKFGNDANDRYVTRYELHGLNSSLNLAWQTAPQRGKGSPSLHFVSRTRRVHVFPVFGVRCRRRVPVVCVPRIGKSGYQRTDGFIDMTVVGVIRRKRDLIYPRRASADDLNSNHDVPGIRSDGSIDLVESPQTRLDWMVAHVVTNACRAVLTMSVDLQTRNTGARQVGANRSPISQSSAKVGFCIYPLKQKRQTMSLQTERLNHGAAATGITRLAFYNAGKISCCARRAKLPTRRKLARAAIRKIQILERIVNHYRRIGFRNKDNSELERDAEGYPSGTRFHWA